MHCPHCASATTKEQIRKTMLGYRTFRATPWENQSHAQNNDELSSIGLQP